MVALILGDKRMNDLIELLSQFHKNAAPFISENEDDSFSLVGSSDYATGEWFDYGKDLGKCKLTAKNHSETLLTLMNFIVLIDALSDAEELSFNDPEVIEFLEKEFEGVLSCYFMKEVKYDNEVAFQFLTDNLQIINEAIYNLTEDKKPPKQLNYQELQDSLEGSQFNDPYIGIAYDIAKKFHIRPSEIIDEWSTSELIVIFAKLSNDSSLESFISWKYSQKKAPKRPNPKKQAFYFQEIEEKGGDEDG